MALKCWKKSYAGNKQDKSRTIQFINNKKKSDDFLNIFSDDNGKSYIVRVDHQVHPFPTGKESTKFRAKAKSFKEAGTKARKYMEDNDKC